MAQTRTHVPNLALPQSAQELAAYLGISADLFEKVTSSADRSVFYEKHEVPRRRPRTDAKTRVVWESGSDELALSHKALARRLDLHARSRNVGYPHPSAFGYVRGRNILENAQVHCGAPRILHVDIKDFFPSIARPQIVRAFRLLGISPTCAELLSRFCTIDDRLALGLNASPLIANLVCLPLDSEFSQLASAHSCAYTRYADDISFSTEGELPPLPKVRSIIETHGFEFAPYKVHESKRGQAHFVTGLSVSADKPHVPRKIRRRLRQELFFCKKFSVDSHAARNGETIQGSVNRIDGMVRYVSGIEAQQRAAIRDTWRTILKEQDVYPSYAPRTSTEYRQLTLIIDETEITRSDGSKVLALGCVLTQDLDRVRQLCSDEARRHAIDPFAPGRPRRIETKGLHYADLHEQVREDFVRAMANMPFCAYVAFAPLANPQDYTQVYLALLRSLLERRYIAADRAELSVLIEENPKIKLAEISRAGNELFSHLEQRKSRRPFLPPTYERATKVENPEVAIPDFMLAVFSAYITLHQGGADVHRMRFERLRDKYRAICDAQRDIFFHRSHAILPWD